MKTNRLSKGQTVKQARALARVRAGLVAGLAFTLSAVGCELIVDFDRTKIDAGGASDATIDVTGDMNVADSPMPDSPNVDGGTDGDSSTPDTGPDSAVDSAADTSPEAGPDADAAVEAEAATAAALTLTATNGGAYGNQNVGTSSADVTFTVTNTGGTASSSVAISVTGAGFVKVADTCNGMTVAANNGTCTFTVHFTPASDGAKTGNASATATMGGAPNVALTGTGRGLVITPASANFMTIDGGMTGTAQAFTITNNASVATGTLLTTPGGADAAQFTFTPDTCTTTMLASMATCSVTANFAPTAGMMGAKSASFTVGAAVGVGGSVTATLTGTAN